MRVKAGAGGGDDNPTDVKQELLKTLGTKKAIIYYDKPSATNYYAYVTEDKKKAPDSAYWFTVGYRITADPLTWGNAGISGRPTFKYYNVNSQKGFNMGISKGVLDVTGVPGTSSNYTYTIHRLKCSGAGTTSSNSIGSVFKSVDGGWAETFDGIDSENSTVYFQPIISVNAQSNGIKGPCYTNKDWYNVFGSGWGPSTVSDMQENYNYKFEKQSEKVTVYYKFKEFVSKDGLDQDDEKGENIAPMVTIEDQSLHSKVKSYKDVLNEVTPDGTITKKGEVWKLKYVYLLYRNDKGVQRQKFCYNMDTKTVSKDTRFDNKTVSNPNMDGNKGVSWGNWIHSIRASNFFAGGTGDCVITFRYVKDEEDKSSKVTVKYEYQKIKEDGTKEWVKLKDNTVTEAPESKVYKKNFDKIPSGTAFSKYGLYSITAYDSSSTTKKYAKNTLTGSTTNNTQQGGVYYYNSSSKWSSLADKIRKCSYAVPEGGLTVLVRYSANIPVVKVSYVYVNGSYKIVGTPEISKVTYIPGSSISTTAPKSITYSGKSFSISSSSAAIGSVKGMYGATENVWEKDTMLPEKGIAPKAGNTAVKRSDTMGNDPLIIMYVYGGPAPVIPPENTTKPPSGGGGESGGGEPPTTTTTEFDIPWDVIDGGKTTPVDDSGNSSVSGLDGTAMSAFSAFIVADPFLSGAFDNKIGIPTSDYQKAYANVLKYQTSGNFKGHTVKVDFPITVQQSVITLTMSTQMVNGKPVPVILPSAPVLHTKKFNVKREITYYTLEYANLWTPKDVTIKNYSLPDPQQYVTMQPTRAHSGQSAAFVDYKKTGSWKQASYQSVVTLPTVSVNAGQSIDMSSWQILAENSVGQLSAKNDQLAFKNGEGLEQTLLKGDSTSSPLPPTMPVASSMTENDVFSKSTLQIEGIKKNGSWNTKACAYYSVDDSASVSGKSKALQYAFTGNMVETHTPVINDVKIVADTKYVQSKYATTGKTLVLDTPFTVSVNTYGYNSSQPGYGYRDYKKYTDRTQLRFPFDVYSGDGTQFFPKHTWINVTSGKYNFILASWNSEGWYSVKYRTLALNTLTNGKMLDQQAYANSDHTKYTAYSEEEVFLSGRVYGLNLFDIGDYPVWKSVFRVGDSNKLTGRTYRTGILNQNGFASGQSAKYTFPLVNGSHPTYQNVGIIKPGYMIRFSLTTVGSMADSNDYVQVRPTFYYVSKDGKQRFPVDVYYDESIRGVRHSAVKIGSAADLKNSKRLSIGDSKWGISELVKADTAKALGYKNTAVWGSKSAAVYTFGNIMLNPYVRTFNGTNHKTILEDGTAKVLERPKGIGYDKKSSSVQQWYCAYYLPSSVHAVRKGYDITNELKSGIDYKEACWLKNGYLLVNFTINTVNSGTLSLGYNAEKGCNMWSIEGRTSTKTDNAGNKFNFAEGDFVLFDLDRSASDDYGSGGTH